MVDEPITPVVPASGNEPGLTPTSTPVGMEPENSPPAQESRKPEKASLSADEDPQNQKEAAGKAVTPSAPDNKKWYVVKVQSGREESIKEAIERRVKIEGLEQYFGQIVIPVEKETVIKNNKRTVRERKLFPGYIMAQVEFNDEILYLFRETAGVGDFVGAGVHQKPQPMPDHEVQKMLAKMGQQEGGEKIVTAKPVFIPGDRVKIKDGVFAGMEGDVKDLIEAKGLVRVETMVLGRPVSVELEYWQVEPV